MGRQPCAARRRWPAMSHVWNFPRGQLISKAVEASGLGVRRFAHEILGRERRVVWRRLAGEHSMPAIVREKCDKFVANRLPVAKGKEPAPIRDYGVQ